MGVKTFQEKYRIDFSSMAVNTQEAWRHRVLEITDECSGFVMPDGTHVRFGRGHRDNDR